jgi:hypothetical protein
VQPVMNPDEDALAIPVLGLRSGPPQALGEVAVNPSYDNPDADPFGIEMRTPIGEMPSGSWLRYDPELQVNVPVGHEGTPPDVQAGSNQETSCGFVFQFRIKGFYIHEEPIWVTYYP